MKKILLIIAVICVGFLSSCKKDERELKSLAGTTWKASIATLDDEIFELRFTETHCTLSHTSAQGVKTDFTNTYRYDPPVVMIVNGDNPIYDGPGEVKGNKLYINIFGGSMSISLEFKQVK